MTIPSIELRTLQDMAAKNVCALHPDLRLIVAYDATQQGPNLHCQDCGKPPTDLTERPTLTSAYKRGQPVPAAVNTHLARRHGEWDRQDPGPLVLRKPTDAELAEAGAELAKAITGFGPTLPAADRILAAQLRQNGFQPFHFNVIHGHLYLNLDGRTFWAQRAMRGSYGGITIEPLDKAAKEQWGIPPGESAVKATLWKVANGQRFPVGQDIGRAGGAKDSGGTRNPIAMANPVEMAIKRATVRVLRTATPLGVDIGTYVQELNEVIDEAVPSLVDEPHSSTLDEAMQADDAAQGVPTDAEDVAVEPLGIPDTTPAPPAAPAGPPALPRDPLTPREIGQKDWGTHPFIVELGFKATEAELFGKGQRALVKYEGKAGDQAIYLMAKDGWSVEDIVEALRRAQEKQT